MSIATFGPTEAHVSKRDPLDGSVSGTIGGGGPETGGPTSRPKGPEIPPGKPDDAASGRLAPDPLRAAEQDREVRVDVNEAPASKDDARKPDR